MSNPPLSCQEEEPLLPFGLFGVLPTELVLYVFTLAVHSRYTLSCVCNSWRRCILYTLSLWLPLWVGSAALSDLQALAFFLPNKPSSWFIGKRAITIHLANEYPRVFMWAKSREFPHEDDLLQARLYRTLAMYTATLPEITVTTGGWYRYLTMAGAIPSRSFPCLLRLTVVITRRYTGIRAKPDAPILLPSLTHVHILQVTNREIFAIEGFISCMLHEDIVVPASALIDVDNGIRFKIWSAIGADVQNARSILRAIVTHTLDLRSEARILRGTDPVPLSTRFLLLATVTSPRPYGLDRYWSKAAHLKAGLRACQTLIVQCSPLWSRLECPENVFGHCRQRLRRGVMCSHAATVLDALEFFMEAQYEYQISRRDGDADTDDLHWESIENTVELVLGTVKSLIRSAGTPVGLKDLQQFLESDIVYGNALF